MGERILDRMHRLTEEYQREQSAKASAARMKLSATAAQPPSMKNDLSPDRTKDELRRARTHRLVQIGALADQYLGSSKLSPEEVGELLARVISVEQVREILK